MGRHSHKRALGLWMNGFFVGEDGRAVQAILDDPIGRTPAVVAAVRSALPADFPGQVADSILGGLQDAANRLWALP